MNRQCVANVGVDECIDTLAQGCSFTRLIQQAVDVGCDQVERATLGWRNNGHTRSERFLNGLAERFVHARMYENIETCKVGSKFGTREKPREYGIRKQALQFVVLRAVTDDDQLDAWVVGQHRQIFDTLFMRESTHIANDDAFAGVPLLAQCLAAPCWAKQLSVNAASPQTDAINAMHFKIVLGR